MGTAACCNFVRDVAVEIIVERFAVKPIKIYVGGFQ